jgi:hypothetical protein
MFPVHEVLSRFTVKAGSYSYPARFVSTTTITITEALSWICGTRLLPADQRFPMADGQQISKTSGYIVSMPVSAGMSRAVRGLRPLSPARSSARAPGPRSAPGCAGSRACTIPPCDGGLLPPSLAEESAEPLAALGDWFRGRGGHGGRTTARSDQVGVSQRGCGRDATTEGALPVSFLTRNTRTRTIDLAAVCRTIFNGTAASPARPAMQPGHHESAGGRPPSRAAPRR